MARFKVLAGTHVGPDPDAQPDENGKRPSITTPIGGVVESDVDLVKKHGALAYRRLADKRVAVVDDGGDVDEDD